MEAHGVGETGVLEEQFERARGQALGAHGRASLGGEHGALSLQRVPTRSLSTFWAALCRFSAPIARVSGGWREQRDPYKTSSYTPPP